MHSTDLLLRTKHAPPQRQRRALPRPALLCQLREALDYRLTLVQAGTGYSKTTALAGLDTGDPLLCWYSIGEEDTDPQRFLAYLIAAFQVRLPGLSELPLAVLRFVVKEPEETPDAPAAGWYSVIRHVQSDTERHFTRWEDIVAFITQYVDLTAEVKHD